jgi:hypothetical protein
VVVDSPKDEGPGDLPEIHDALLDMEQKPGDDQWEPESRSSPQRYLGKTGLSLAPMETPATWWIPGRLNTRVSNSRRPARLRPEARQSRAARSPTSCAWTEPELAHLPAGVLGQPTTRKVWVGYTGGCT